MSETLTVLAKLREPFPPNQISKLPKETKAQTEARKNNREGINCQVCGGWHHPRAVHLDYVGHAALTDRLLDVDPAWTWEPMAVTPEGLPALDRNGGLWIKLTVAGVTRLGYGAADGKSGGDAVKEIIGDALRNAAMRFGAALDLWHKGDLHGEEEPEQRPTPQHDPAPRQRERAPAESKPVDGKTLSATQLAQAFAADAIAEFDKMTDMDSTHFDRVVDSNKYKTGMERLRVGNPDLYSKVVAARDAAFERMDTVPF